MEKYFRKNGMVTVSFEIEATYSVRNSIIPNLGQGVSELRAHYPRVSWANFDSVL